MSEKIYTWLLRLYPSHFRAAYGEEALQLFRDRARDEQGFFRGLCLWLDLLADLAVSVPQQHRSVACSARPPCFHVLDGETVRAGPLLFGGLLSVVAFSACSIAIHSGGNHGPLFALKRPAPQAAIVAGREEVDAGERQRVIHASIANLKQHYIDPDVAQKMADALLAHEMRGDYDAVADGAAFAALLTRQMRDVSHDGHLIVVYNKTARPDRPSGPTPESLARYRKAMEESNCTFEKVETRPHN